MSEAFDVIGLVISGVSFSKTVYRELRNYQKNYSDVDSHVEDLAGGLNSLQSFLRRLEDVVFDSPEMQRPTRSHRNQRVRFELCSRIVSLHQFLERLDTTLSHVRLG